MPRPCLVLKFGGSSVGTAEKMQAVARRIARFRQDGYNVATVVSAMGDTTDDLLALAGQLAPGLRSGREMDQLLATGEQQSVALLAMTLENMGVMARSMTGPQWGLRGRGRHGMGLIDSLDPSGVLRAFEEGAVVVAAGFQALDAKGDLITLGRGGSDLSAIALAGGLNARTCTIYTDVDGLYSADPRRVNKAQKIDRISDELCLEMTVSGAKVLQSRCVELAARLEVPLFLAHSQQEGGGSWIMKEVKETSQVVALVDQPGWARLAVKCSDYQGFTRLLGGLNDLGVAPLEFSYSDGGGELWLLANALPAALSSAQRWNATISVINQQLGKISIIGPGLGNHGEFASLLPKLLESQKIAVHRLVSTGNSIALWIDEGQLSLGLNYLHKKLIEEGQDVEGCPCPSL